jgi:putative transposase
MARRPQRVPTDDWQQLELAFTDPVQRTYELIRPVVLFGLSPAERATQTGAAERTLYRHVERFTTGGMAKLFPTPPVPSPSRLPDDVRVFIAEAKAEYPPLHLRELQTMCFVRFGRRPSRQTIKRVLAETTPSRPRTRRYPLFHDMEPDARRVAIIRLHADGWNAKSIALYLKTSRQTVHATLKRWVEEGFRGLPNKRSTPKQPTRKVTFAALTAVRRLGHNKAIGAWRVQQALKDVGIRLSPRTCGRLLAFNRALYKEPEPPPRPKKEMPFRAKHRHQYWTVDIRYLPHTLDSDNVYCISILENYSRAIVASAISRTQDLTAYLIVLFAAIKEHGSPEGLVSDGGAVFRAKQAMEIYRRLGIIKLQIEKRQSWQSYIETAFSVQHRMADYHFERATTWAELQAVHTRWCLDYNYQGHWAHRTREDGRASPAEVIDWVKGQVWEPARLHVAFHATRFTRRLDRLGYVRFRDYRVYSELGLARRPVAVWLYEERLTIAFDNTLLAQSTVEYQPDGKHFRAVSPPHLYTTAYQSPQLSLWELGEHEWVKVLRLPPRILRRKRPYPPVIQTQLFNEQA